MSTSAKTIWKANGLAQPNPIKAAKEAAKSAGLRYLSDRTVGIRRKRAGKNFYYLGIDGKRLRDREELHRIKSLAIPPAWNDVWICPVAHGHLQATGRDARGRKQYRYHPRWRAVRDDNKYDRMVAFGLALPRIRERIDDDLALTGLPRAKVLATVVHLLETTLIRVGNEEYARSNGSFGLTTMRDSHVRIQGGAMKFQFRGKSGILHTIKLDDRRLARIVKRCQELPGQELFQYLDEDGRPQTISSSDVNDYLREITGDEFTAKDFRTWAGTVLACTGLRESNTFTRAAEAKRNIARAIENVSLRLGNTPTVCRKSYIHPAILELYTEGSLNEKVEMILQQNSKEKPKSLRPEEAVVLAILQERIKG